MSYVDAKAARQQVLIASVHGSPDSADVPVTSAEPDFDGGVRVPGYVPDPSIRHKSLPPLADEPREIGWGPAIELEDGARLFFGDLGGR